MLELLVPKPSKQLSLTCHNHHESMHLYFSKGTSLCAVTFMLRSSLDLPVTLIVDLSLASVIQYSPFQFHAFA